MLLGKRIIFCHITFEYSDCKYSSKIEKAQIILPFSTKIYLPALF